jgi:hypothetical protein
MFNKFKNLTTIENPPIRTYVEFYLSKYQRLSSCELTILIHALIKSDMSFKKLQSNIATILTKLKNQGKIKKVKGMQWLWIYHPELNIDEE